MASCSVPGEVEGVSDDEDLVDVEYALGSLVWAKFKGKYFENSRKHVFIFIEILPPI